MNAPYNFIVETVTSAVLQDLFNNIRYYDFEGNRKQLRVGLSNGRKDILSKLYYDERKNDENFRIQNFLPAISLSMSGGYEDIDEIDMIKLNKAEFRDTGNKLLSGVPKRLTFNGIIGTGKMRTMLMIMEQLDLLYHQQRSIDVKYPILDMLPVSTGFVYEFGSIDDGAEDLSEQDDDIIFASFTITVEPVWIFNASIEKINYSSIIRIIGKTFVQEYLPTEE